MPVDQMRRATPPAAIEEPSPPLPGEGHLHATPERIEGESADRRDARRDC
jgi:hypothetical protein